MFIIGQTFKQIHLTYSWRSFLINSIRYFLFATWFITAVSDVYIEESYFLMQS